jgi:hypothetical protein
MVKFIYTLIGLTCAFMYLALPTHASAVEFTQGITIVDGDTFTFTPTQSAIITDAHVYHKVAVSYNTATIDGAFEIYDDTDNFLLGYWDQSFYQVQFVSNVNNTRTYRHNHSFSSMPFTAVAGHTYRFEKLVVPNSFTISYQVSPPPSVFGILPSDEISITKASPVGNPFVDETVVYTVDYTAVDYEYVYYACEESEGYALHTSQANGDGLFQFICTYDYPYTYHPTVQLREFPLASGTGGVLTEFINVQVIDANSDLSTFKVNKSSTTVSGSILFTWDLDTNYHTNITNVALNVGYPSNVQAPINFNTATGSYSYQYNTVPPNPNLFPTLTVNSDNNKVYTKSILVTKTDLTNFDLSSEYGGTVEDNGNFWHFSTPASTYNIGHEVVFNYLISTLPNCTYDNTTFRPNLLSAPVTLNLQSSIYTSFTHTYTVQGRFFPSVAHNYTCNGSPYTFKLYLGSVNLNEALPLTIIDSEGYCVTVPYVTQTGIFGNCELINSFMASIPLSTIHLPITHGFMWLGSLSYSYLEQTLIYKKFTFLVDPPSNTYSLDMSVISEDFVDTPYLPNEFSLTRRNFNSTPLDSFIVLFINLYFLQLLVVYVFELILTKE